MIVRKASTQPARAKVLAERGPRQGTPGQRDSRKSGPRALRAPGPGFKESRAPISQRDRWLSGTRWVQWGASESIDPLTRFAPSTFPSFLLPASPRRPILPFRIPLSKSPCSLTPFSLSVSVDFPARRRRKGGESTISG